MFYIKLTVPELQRLLSDGAPAQRFFRVFHAHGGRPAPIDLFEYVYEPFSRQWNWRRRLTTAFWVAGAGMTAVGLLTNIVSAHPNVLPVVAGFSLILWAIWRMIQDDNEHSEICRRFSRRAKKGVLQEAVRGEIFVGGTVPAEERAFVSRMIGRTSSHEWCP